MKLACPACRVEFETDYPGLLWCRVCKTKRGKCVLLVRAEDVHAPEFEIYRLPPEEVSESAARQGRDCEAPNPAASPHRYGNPW